VLAVGCDIYTPPWSLSTCVSYDRVHTYAALQCLAAATTCDEVATCNGYGVYKGTCSPTDGKWKCDGDLAVQCDSTPPNAWNCKTRGATCEVTADTIAANDIPCAVKDSCLTTTSGCDGQSFYNCVDGKEYGANCSLQAAHCALSSSNAPNCYYDETSCPAGAGAIACDGSKLVLCDDTGSRTYDCGKSGLNCHIEGTEGYCLAPGCTPADNPCKESCSGSKATICIGRAPYTFDCTDYKFAGCQLANDPTLGSYAVCTN
jgi:hypothetical protein